MGDAVKDLMTPVERIKTAFINLMRDAFMPILKNAILPMINGLDSLMDSAGAAYTWVQDKLGGLFQAFGFSPEAASSIGKVLGAIGGLAMGAAMIKLIAKGLASLAMKIIGGAAKTLGLDGARNSLLGSILGAIRLGGMGGGGMPGGGGGRGGRGGGGRGRPRPRGGMRMGGRVGGLINMGMMGGTMLGGPSGAPPGPPPGAPPRPPAGGGGGIMGTLKGWGSSIASKASAAWGATKSAGKSALQAGVGVVDAGMGALGKAGKGLANMTRSVAESKIGKLLTKYVGAAGGGLFKILKSAPGLGAIMEMFFAVPQAMDVMKNPELSQSDKEQEIGKIVASSIGGVAIGSLLGAALTAVPGGSFLGFLAGDWVGRHLGEWVADNLGAKPLGAGFMKLAGSFGAGAASPSTPDTASAAKPIPVNDGGPFMFNPQDSFYAAKPGGALDEKMDEMIGVLREMAQAGSNKEVVLNIDRREIGRVAIASINKDFYPDLGV